MKIKKGFTLIELLVVIAIIALLLSVILPSLRLAKEKAKNLSCRSDTRSLSMALRLYTEMSDGRIWGYGAGGQNSLWLTQLEEEIDDIDQVRYCSTTKVDEKRTTAAWGSYNTTWTWTAGLLQPEHGSYALNGWLYATTPSYIVPTNEFESSGWKTTIQTANSASIPVFYDAVWVDAWPQSDDTVSPTFNLETGASGGDGAGRNHIGRMLINRHMGSINVSFLDGHAESVPLKKLWSLKWSKDFEIFAGDKLRTDDTPIYKK